MPPMVTLESKEAHQSSERSSQAPTLTTNGSSTVKQSIFIDAQGQPLNICVSQTVPGREEVESKIKEHGGNLTVEESKATIKLGAPGRSTQEKIFSVQWLYDCIKENKLLEHDTFAYRLRAAKRASKICFTRDDDKLLEDFIAVKKAENGPINGNRIYEEFANKHNTHSAQSWRDRAINTLNLTSGPSPYELSKAKREEARRKQQEKLAADKLMLEVTQQKILGQNLQAAQDAKSGSEHKLVQPSPISKQQNQQNQQPPILTGGTTERRLQVIDSDSDEEVKQESPLRPTHHFSRAQHSQQAILVFSDIESTDEEDRLHKIERDAIAHRRNYPNPQMGAVKSYASQTEDETITPGQKSLLEASKSPSPPPLLRSPNPRNSSPAVNKHSRQDQDDVPDAPSGGHPYNRNGTREVSDHDDPFLEYKDTVELSENKGVDPSPDHNSSADHTLRKNGDSTGIHFSKNSNNNVNALSTSDQPDNHTGIDASLIDLLEDNSVRSIYKGVGNDDDSDYLEPNHSKPVSQPRKLVKATRTRPATLSPKAKNAESPHFLQDLTRRRIARRSLPNRSWNQDILPSSKGTKTKILPAESFDDDNVSSDKRSAAGTPTKDGLVDTQDPPVSPSLSTWRNSPQARLSIPDTLLASLQNMPTLESQQDEHTTDDSQGPVASDTQEVVTVESTEDEFLIKSLKESSVGGDLQGEPVADDWQDKPVVDELYDDLVVQERTDEPSEAKHFQEADVSDQSGNRDLMDEDDIAIEQRILRKKQARHLSPLESREQISSSLAPTSPTNTMPTAQEASDSEDDHTAYELPAKLLSHTPAQRHQAQSSYTAWSGGMSFQGKRLHPGREGSTGAADADLGSRDVSGPVSREVSSSDDSGEESQDEVQLYLLSNSVQIKVAETRTVVETVKMVESTDTDEIEALLPGDEQKDETVVGETNAVVQVEQEEYADIAQTVQEKAQVSSRAASSVTPRSRDEHDTRELSVLSSLSLSKDVMRDYYSGEGDNESLEKRREREQLLLYLRDLYRKEIRTLMLHELVPALRSIDVLDACSGDFELAKTLISKGMTEDIETHFWTREDDCRLFSSSDEDVKGLLERHSAVELIQRTRYLTRTREEGRQFEVAADAMEKSGLLKRARGRFGSRESKRVRLDEGEP
ncbi:hypothetical protein BGX24_002440 [Mortierella sp. AD032]|nr:hypothetical protein BGX24_002440 [Mortierella sp. AD032]